MKHLLHLSTLLLLGFSQPPPTLAADDYDFTYSTSSYTPLSSPTIAVPDAFIATGIFSTIPIGFNFTYWGTSYTTFTFTSYAYCFLGSTTTYGFYPFYSNLQGQGDSYIGHFLDNSGGTGHRILKVEWHHVGFQADATHADNTTFQVWLREDNNAVEFHFGPSSIAQAHYAALFGSASGTQLAFSDPTLSSFYNLQGDPAAPTAIYHPGTFLYLSGYPSAGTIYAFAPANLSGIQPSEPKDLALQLFPQPAMGALHLKLADAPIAADRYALLHEGGELIREAQLTGDEIDISSLPAGTYVLCLFQGGRSTAARFVHVVR